MINTRLDNRSEQNDRLYIKDAEGNVLAEIISASPRCSLKITTKEGLHIEKPNGYTSKRTG